MIKTFVKKNQRLFVLFVLCFSLLFLFGVKSTLINHKGTKNTTAYDNETNLRESSAQLTLLNPDVTPDIGVNTTIFNFTVTFKDINNDLPSYVNITINSTTYPMEKANSSDMISSDGISYFFETTLDWGYYEFQINCSDGTYSNATEWIDGPEVNPLYLDSEMENVAIFKDGDPWNDNNNEDILNAQGITYTRYYSSDFGSISLDEYDKVIIPSVQGSTFYTQLLDPATADWFESYVNSGGVLQIHAVTQGTNLNGLPFGYNAPHSQQTDMAFNSTYLDHPILNNSSPTEFGYSYDAHNYIQNPTDGDKVLVYNQNTFTPWLILSDYGYGQIIYSTITLEYAYDEGHNNMLEDVIAYIPENDYKFLLQGPANNSLSEPGLYNFSWTNIKTKLKSINYTLQISNSSEFSTILIEEGDIQEQENLTNKTVNIENEGQYYWRVRPEYEVFSLNWSKPFSFRILKDDYAPSLSGSHVDPKSGNQHTTYNFTVIYTDQDNNAPTSINVTINGTNYRMAQQDPSDENYADGVVYQYLTKLFQAPHNYSYSYSCKDLTLEDTTIGYNDLEVSEANLYSPELKNATVSPAVGSNNTLFNFTVQYFDLDNNFPVWVNITLNETGTYPMVQANPSDSNVEDGILFSFNTTLDLGFYSFQMNASDGTFLNSTLWKNGPESNPFYGESSNLFYDDFEDGSLVPEWAINYGNAEINSAYSQSGIYSLAIDAASTGTQIDSKIIDLSLYNSVNLSLWIQQGGSQSEPPDSGEDLYLYYYNNQNGWTLLEQFFGSETNEKVYNRNYLLPADACHSNFQLRLEHEGGTMNPGDWWHIDDVKLYTTAPKPTDLITPANESSLFSGPVNFTWSSLDAHFGKVNYSVQLSNKSDFSVNISEWNHIPEVSGITNLTTYLALQSGVYYWRVKPVYGKFNGIWSDVSWFNLTYNENSPQLSNLELNPHSGNQYTLFNFTVTYSDSDNNSPYSINITIDGEIYSMLKANISDNNYADGCLYQYNSTFLPSATNYSYSVDVYDGRFSANTAQYSNFNVTNEEPILTGGMLSPLIGDQLTEFNFTVLYTDFDNDTPSAVNLILNDTIYSLEKSDTLDVNYVDGVLYEFVSILPAAPNNYTYFFNCSDGYTQSNTTRKNNLEVYKTNNFTPKLLDPSVNPSIGSNTTLYNFTVSYYDADNNFPTHINITINETGTYSMEKVDSNDLNATDGVLYYYNTTLAFGYYQYHINCTDGTFLNSTEWRLGPESNPFYELNYLGNQLVINEIGTGIDYVEFYNYGRDRDMTGWYVEVYDSNTLDTTYTFSNGWIFGSESVVVLHESTGTETSSDLYMGINVAFFGGIAIGLFDEDGNNIDWFQTSDFTGSAPIDAEWIEDTTVSVDSYIYRINDYDTNKASDWASGSTGSMGGLNPGQTGMISSNLLILYTPEDNQVIYSGINNFSWSSIEPTFGSINYSLQISSQLDFSTVDLHITDIQEKEIITNKTIELTLPIGMYYWRVRPVYKNLYGNWSHSKCFNLTVNDYAPTLTSPNVVPKTGNQFTNFNFTVVYTDMDNNAPYYVNVIINETVYPMIKNDSMDSDYTDGCVYVFSISLAVAPHNYHYQFECSDGKRDDITSLFTDLQCIEVNLNAPTLTTGQVTPTFGYVEGTTFELTITYTDADNNTPSYVRCEIDSQTFDMQKQNALDNNYLDGCVFTYSLIFDTPGNFSFIFKASDGAHQIKTAPYSGPEVELHYAKMRLDGVKIGAIITHGETNPLSDYSSFIVSLTARGAICSTIDVVINSSLLNEYDIIWIDEYGSGITESEIGAIVTWIRNGGRLIITGNSLSTGNEILQELSMEIYTDTYISYTGISNIEEHSITKDVSQVYIYSTNIYVNTSSQPGAQSLVKYGDNTLVAALTYGRGALVTMTDEFPDYYNSYDNYFLLNNTFGWLAHYQIGGLGGSNDLDDTKDDGIPPSQATLIILIVVLSSAGALVGVGFFIRKRKQQKALEQPNKEKIKPSKITKKPESQSSIKNPLPSSDVSSADKGDPENPETSTESQDNSGNQFTQEE